MAQLNGWMTIADAYANALFAGAGWDSVTLDAQHGLFDDRALRDTLLALSATTPRRFVRLAGNDPHLVGRALDLGADGVIVPMIDSVADAQALAGACWYPPRGARSFGPALAALRAGAQPYEAFAGAIEVWAMIETRGGLEAVEDIAAVDGITGLYVGPNDLALALGLPPGSSREEPQMLEAFARVVAAAGAAGKASCIFCVAPAYARRMADLGFTMVTVAGDAALMRGAAAAAVAQMKG
jgi:4-hydroxy-2-oxoheptanedioate aldolase